MNPPGLHALFIDFFHGSGAEMLLADTFAAVQDECATVAYLNAWHAQFLLDWLHSGRHSGRIQHNTCSAVHRPSNGFAYFRMEYFSVIQKSSVNVQTNNFIFHDDSFRYPAYSFSRLRSVLCFILFVKSRNTEVLTFQGRPDLLSLFFPQKPVNLPVPHNQLHTDITVASDNFADRLTDPFLSFRISRKSQGNERLFHHLT